MTDDLRATQSAGHCIGIAHIPDDQHCLLRDPAGAAGAAEPRARVGHPGVEAAYAAGDRERIADGPVGAGEVDRAPSHHEWGSE